MTTKIKSGTPYTYNNTPVWLHHDRQDGTATIRYCQSKYDAKKIDLVSVEDLKPIVKTKEPIAKASVNRDKENKAYLGLRKVFLENHEYCEANVAGCTRIATTVHHGGGRQGKRLLDVSSFVALCMSCHEWCEKNPSMAKEMGLSVNRL